MSRLVGIFQKPGISAHRLCNSPAIRRGRCNYLETVPPDCVAPPGLVRRY
jgi:hypothetical protein